MRFKLICAVAMGLMIGAGVRAEEAVRVLGDQEFFTKGSYIAYAAPWATYFGAGTAMKRGLDFQDEVTVQAGSFPGSSEIAWHWPLKGPTHTGVYGYLALSFGNYDGGVPEAPVTPRQVKAVGKFAQTYRYELGHPVGDFNVLSEFYLTKPDGEKLAEVGFFLRPAQSAVTFVETGEQLGTYTDEAGRAWKVAKQAAPHGPFLMFLPAEPVLEGKIDWKAAVEFLRSKGQATGEEWIAGVALGVEPVNGSGLMKVREWAVVLE